MVTVTCRFTFPSGGIAEAAVSAIAPEDAMPVQYSGAVSLFPDKHEDCEVSTLQFWARRIAKQTGAALEIRLTGQYDTWAE